jgi:hypothetical protein
MSDAFTFSFVHFLDGRLIIPVFLSSRQLAAAALTLFIYFFEKEKQK